MPEEMQCSWHILHARVTLYLHILWLKSTLCLTLYLDQHRNTESDELSVKVALHFKEITTYLKVEIQVSFLRKKGSVIRRWYVTWNPASEVKETLRQETM